VVHHQFDDEWYQFAQQLAAVAQLCSVDGAASSGAVMQQLSVVE
jgi:hypothetical protein